MSRITTDFHSHILPGADHGSRRVETSVAQLSLMAHHGIKRVVATPHFYPMSDNPDTFLDRRERCARDLKGAMKPGDPSVMLGAEVLICEGIERMEGLESLTVYGTKCILLEMPMIKWSDALFETVDAIASSGLIPVMAHIDRYESKYINELMKLNVRAQLNPDPFYSIKGRRFAEKWLSEGKVAAVGSDLHGANEKDYRSFIGAIDALKDRADMIENSMKELLSGAKMISYRPAQNGSEED